MTPAEFRRLILPEGRRLYALAFRYLNNREEAEDTVQEAFLRILESGNEKNLPDNPAAWTATVVRNLCIDRLRVRSRSADDEKALENKYEEPDHEADHREGAGLAMKIIDMMKEPYKSAIILRDIEGYSYEEAAGILEMNVVALRTVISRARRMVREEMEKIYNYGTGRV